MDDVAEAAGVSHGLLFQYFGSKKGLYIAGIDALLEEFRRRTEPDPALPPRERLRVGLRAYVDWVAEHPRGFRSLMRKAGAFREVRERIDRQRWHGIETRLSAGLGADPQRPAVRVGLWAWQGFVESAILAWLDHQELDRDAFVQILMDAFLGVVEAIAAADPDALPNPPGTPGS